MADLLAGETDDNLRLLPEAEALLHLIKALHDGVLRLLLNFQGGRSLFLNQAVKSIDSGKRRVQDVDGCWC